MKVAIPVWDSRISPVFDTASRVLIVTVESSEEVARTEAPLSEEILHSRTNWLVQRGIDVLVCGAISRPLANMIVSSGIELIPWMSGEAEEVLEAFLKGKLPDPKFLMPGCCRGPRRRRNRMEQFGWRRRFGQWRG